MTIEEAIQKVDSLKPNAYTQHEKINWLSTLDGAVKTEILDTHLLNEDEEEVTFTGYDDDTPMDTVLLVTDPYTDIYEYWLEQAIDYANGETAKYSNSVTRYNDYFTMYNRWYNRTHMPKPMHHRYY